LEILRYPALARILDASANISAQPISLQERFFVSMIFQQLNASFQAMKNGLVVKPEGVRKDVRSFVSLPIPKAVWEKAKSLQNEDFVRFVEDCLE
jgi:hypothetical protein